jgi:hypothetical protein
LFSLDFTPGNAAILFSSYHIARTYIGKPVFCSEALAKAAILLPFENMPAPELCDLPYFLVEINLSQIHQFSIILL